MTQDEAARNDGPQRDGGATPGASASDAPAKPDQPQLPADERPRPRYGEYAPEGWTWQPPAPRDAPQPAQSPAAPPPAADRFTFGGGADRADGAARPPVVHPIDRMWTIALLVFGALGAVYNVFSLIALPQSVLQSAQMSAQILGTDPPTSFTAGPAVPVIIGFGAILQLALWIGALLWSRARMRAGRLAWWIPLVAGVAAFIVVLVVSMLVFASDPEFFRTLSTVPGAGS
ncbi:DUF6264 family protein [Agromyces sp. LHK192]|uniref:DUF6264 family protein n=1 Tax=Agromyces sp. LHK192 TaxID=2498704 RepID=UPI000FDA4035|nr:DUF6264 family protein [Agromyces sp. LHK192]